MHAIMLMFATLRYRAGSVTGLNAVKQCRLGDATAGDGFTASPALLHGSISAAPRYGYAFPLQAV